MQNVMPALRITDYERSRAFYVDGLGFTIEREHRFAPGMPVFLGRRTRISVASASLEASSERGYS
jgi:catechol 2,3-dioxygenase-like lactoylglutathione lyase family enzyme